ncbi:CAF1 family ribonuclease [Oesophagostomum dentatum]|uniref:CAF1 family ribonuclease n=1 Tax=Oesophagostomum dentatum TaxID=61180 RepID=A0A0B1SXF8_OESDE|nr:CAF1 family ribonuclease [Oesophagostomum dentatum]
MRVSNSLENIAAVDLEFLGLPALNGKESISLFDTPEQRYEKLCDVIRKFPPCQLGLACFKEGGSYTADVYCISLFKRLSHTEFCVSPIAADFLSRHNFDFNKFIAEGITYCNRSELSKWKNDTEHGEFDFRHVLSLPCNKAREKNKEDEKNDCCQDPFFTIHVEKPLLVELLGSGAVFDRPLSQLEQGALTYALQEEFPHLSFTFSGQGTMVKS